MQPWSFHSWQAADCCCVSYSRGVYALLEGGLYNGLSQLPATLIRLRLCCQTSADHAAIESSLDANSMV